MDPPSLFKKGSQPGGEHTVGKFLVTKFEFGESFGVTWEGHCHEVKVTLNLKLLVTFYVSLEVVCHELYT